MSPTLLLGGVMTHLRKVMVAVVGLLLLVLAGCSTYGDIAKQNYGVEPGVSYSVLVGKVQTGVVGEGSVFLFIGSMSSTTQSSLRMGYTNALGNSYILDIPMKSIEFHAQDPNVEPSAQFSFKKTIPGGNQASTLQGIIDEGVDKVILTITPDQWEQLVTG
ncbi:MAG: hypothetical protein WBP12_01450 [Candidatus Saccharimonas sp.]